jgi:hypothetical protein
MMTDDAIGFEFSDGGFSDGASSNGGDAPTTASASRQRSPRSRSPVLVRLPAGLRSKRKLLSEYAAQLSLPEYFGWNWDALEECLRDLSWLDDKRPVVITHAGLPFHGHPGTRKTYLRLLQAVGEFWAGWQPGRLRILFTRRSEATIRQLLSTDS